MLYSVAMGVDAIAALVFGRLYDRLGLGILVFAAFFSTLVAPLVFWVVSGPYFWG